MEIMVTEKNDRWKSIMTGGNLDRWNHDSQIAEKMEIMTDGNHDKWKS